MGAHVGARARECVRMYARARVCVHVHVCVRARARRLVFPCGGAPWPVFTELRPDKGHIKKSRGCADAALERAGAPAHVPVAAWLPATLHTRVQRMVGLHPSARAQAVVEGSSQRRLGWNQGCLGPSCACTQQLAHSTLLQGGALLLGPGVLCAQPALLTPTHFSGPMTCVRN